jgi:uncharacterized membrane protein (UPF0127 family)
MRVFASMRGAGNLARMRTFLTLLFSLLFVAGACARDITTAQPTLPTTPMIIDTVKGANRFNVEMALTWEQQEVGLMFRRTLAPNAGMLFDFVRESNQAFWMKNTLIPLDLIFIKANGTIARIAPNCKPLSEDPIPSYEPVRAVLEIPGGRAAELGMKAGDKVHNGIFGNMPK